MLNHYKTITRFFSIEETNILRLFSSIPPRCLQMVSVLRSNFPGKVVVVVVEAAFASSHPQPPQPRRVYSSWGHSRDPNPEHCCSVEAGAEAWPLVFAASQPHY